MACPLYSRGRSFNVHFGFLTGDAADIAKAARLGFDGIELKAEAFGNPRTGPLDPGLVRSAREQAAEHGVTITAVAYYGLAGGGGGSDWVTEAYDHVFDAAEALDVNVIASMSGFDPDRDWDGNMRLFSRPVRAGGGTGGGPWPAHRLRELDGFWGAPALPPGQHGRFARYLGRLVHGGALARARVGVRSVPPLLAGNRPYSRPSRIRIPGLPRPRQGYGDAAGAPLPAGRQRPSLPVPHPRLRRDQLGRVHLGAERDRLHGRGRDRT